MIAGAAFVNKKCQLSSVFGFCNQLLRHLIINSSLSWLLSGLKLVSLGRIEHGMGLESKDQNSNNIGLSCYSAFSEAEFNLRSLSTNIFVGSKNI